ncbi:hypothetical protein TIFTF001_028339 [Ficus carica]|uniref:Uncharacterized protein n=1 Tax=Ficus carica TaxID=3494 RepID=A0AA88DQX9_FICCA|nr:hypothetical protein TIFTF001_028339 [Ficus carica]
MKRKREQDKAIAPKPNNEPQATKEKEANIHDHLDEFSWDGLKCILRGIGLIYHSTDNVVERRERIRELENTNRERIEKLLNIERKFKDVRASADDLFKELETLNRTVKEGVEMMKCMVDRLVARIVGKYEKATLKAHFKLLKEYKQGLAFL